MRLSRCIRQYFPDLSQTEAERRTEKAVASLTCPEKDCGEKAEGLYQLRDHLRDAHGRCAKLMAGGGGLFGMIADQLGLVRCDRCNQVLMDDPRARRSHLRHAHKIPTASMVRTSAKDGDDKAQLKHVMDEAEGREEAETADMNDSSEEDDTDQEDDDDDNEEDRARKLILDKCRMNCPCCASRRFSSMVNLKLHIQNSHPDREEEMENILQG